MSHQLNGLVHEAHQFCFFIIIILSDILFLYFNHDVILKG